MTPQRPALAEVLAAITDRPVGHWRAEIASPAFVRVERISSRDVQWTVRVDPFRAPTQTRRTSLRTTEPAYEARRVGNTLTRVEVAPAHTITPAEAVEAIAGLWPWPVGDTSAPLWWCDRCARQGWQCDGPIACVCDHDGTAPPSLAALVAIASLGAGQLARYVHLAGEIARAAGCAEARVAWRVMTREALRKHCDAAHPRGDEGFSPVTFFAHQVRWEMRGLKVDFEKGEGFGRAIIEATWPMLRDLHAGGVHLVALDASRIVLAVEAL